MSTYAYGGYRTYFIINGITELEYPNFEYLGNIDFYILIYYC